MSHRTILGETEFERLRALVHKRTGIELKPDSRFSLEARLRSRVHELGFETFDDYVRLLSIGPYRDDEFTELIGRSNLAETCFFRHRRQLRWFEEHTLPDLIRKRLASRTLRIWCAACATGEEAYSLAILVHRALGTEADRWNVEILATDANQRNLDTTLRAEYSPFSLPAVEADIKSRYFTSIDGRFRVDPDILSMVTVRRHNLADVLAARRFGVWDAIFCRNTLELLDLESRADVMWMFAERLATDGRLFVSPEHWVEPSDAPLRPDHAGPGVFAPAQPETADRA